MNSRTAAADALPTGSRIASFEIEAVIARGPSSFVYLAQDLRRGMPVVIKEYAPARRIGAAPNEPTDPLVQRGLQAFMAEARILAACHHPSLVRVEALLDAHATAYRVMPFYKGLSLGHVRSGLGRAPDDATLRAWGSDLRGALQAMHDTGHAHGGVSPENIMLLADDRPLLFGAGSASHRVGSDLVESLLAHYGLNGAAAANGEPNLKLLTIAAAGSVIDDAPAVSVVPLEAVADDMRALAAVLRFCINGDLTSATPLSEVAAPHFIGMPAAAAATQAVSQAPRDPSAELPLLSDLLAEQAASGGADPVASSATTETAHEPQPDAWFATPPIPIAAIPSPSAVAPRPLIPERWHIPLWVGLIALAGVGVLTFMGYVMGAWNRMPPIDFDRSLQTASVSAPTPVASPPSSASASAASGALSPTAALLTGPRDAPEAGLPAPVKTVAKAVDKRGPQKVIKRATKKVLPKRPARRTQPAAVPVLSPRTACGSRANFALERCMQIQCQNKKWASHPQCISRRSG